MRTATPLTTWVPIRLPELAAIGDKTVDEETALTFSATATDADLPANTLTFSLVGAPAGASITGAGAVSWTPTEAQGPNSYTFTVKVTDNGSPALSDEEEITVVVKEVNKAPVVSTANGPKITIRSGDTLSKLAAKHDVRGGWQALFSANRGTIRNADLIYVGQVIRLP